MGAKVLYPDGVTSLRMVCWYRAVVKVREIPGDMMQ